MYSLLLGHGNEKMPNTLFGGASIRPFGPFAKRKCLYTPPFGGIRHQ